MANSSNHSTSSASRIHTRKRPDLELITCTKCGIHKILEFQVKKDEHGNQGRIFFKCTGRNWDGSGCNF
ncbi:hypothetical protein PVAP13_1KG111710 [Panicum virgatum]|uniref:Uncharacterized protein n=1 Tax=Panicum virgatum TaxID=38727 RepID=A0A8T0XXX7_PANVG|nr:hypothetical protein PVAP13_1KG111710 [Panicum virgatum]